MKKNRILLIVISTLLMIIGSSIYLLFNQEAYVSKVFLSFFDIPKVTTQENIIIYGLRCYGADFLWACAFTLVIQSILYFQKEKIWWLLLCSTLGIMFEIAQFLGIANGTPDIIDILTYISGTLTGILITWRLVK